MDGAGMPAEIILTDQTTPNPGADTIDTPKYDPEGAKALLAEAGYPDGFTMEIAADMSASDTMTMALEIIKEQLAQAAKALEEADREAAAAGYEMETAQSQLREWEDAILKAAGEAAH